MTRVTDLDLHDTARGLASGDFSARELVEAYLERISALDGELNSFVVVLADSALAGAARADLRRAKRSRLGPLDGIPLAVKDNIDIAGVPTTNGLARHDGLEPAAVDAFAITRLRAAGAVFIGKSNMDEGALGGGTDNPHHGRTQNPWRIGHTAGGSSGGSAAATAGRLAVAALGSDTMGSVRIPASYCGVVGLKPTFGLVSTRGVAPMSWRLDHLGVLCRSVRDCSLLLRVIAGPDPDCMESVQPPNGFNLSTPPGHGLAGQRIGLITNFAEVPLHPDVAAGFSKALKLLGDLGCEVRELELANYRPTPARLAGLLVGEAESAVFHEAAIRQHPEIYSPYYTEMITFGSTTSGLKLMKAERRVRSAAHRFLQLFRDVNLIVSPTVPGTAYPFDAGGEPYQADMLALANFAGCPAISIPCGLDSGGLPTGLQLVAAPWCDGELIAAATSLESALQFNVRPPL
jgi:aspartyl-tRNA(Asn)/glutamyl-tRNA(Gln) amidotransferase subunit A